MKTLQAVPTCRKNILNKLNLQHDGIGSDYSTTSQRL